MELRHMTQFK